MPSGGYLRAHEAKKKAQTSDKPASGKTAGAMAHDKWVSDEQRQAAIRRDNARRRRQQQAAIEKRQKEEERRREEALKSRRTKHTRYVEQMKTVLRNRGNGRVTRAAQAAFAQPRKLEPIQQQRNTTKQGQAPPQVKRVSRAARPPQHHEVDTHNIDSHKAAEPLRISVSKEAKAARPQSSHGPLPATPPGPPSRSDDPPSRAAFYDSLEGPISAGAGPGAEPTVVRVSRDHGLTADIPQDPANVAVVQVTPTKEEYFESQLSRGLHVDIPSSNATAATANNSGNNSPSGPRTPRARRQAAYRQRKKNQKMALRESADRLEQGITDIRVSGELWARGSGSLLDSLDLADAGEKQPFGFLPKLTRGTQPNRESVKLRARGVVNPHAARRGGQQRTGQPGTRPAPTAKTGGAMGGGGKGGAIRQPRSNLAALARAEAADMENGLLPNPLHMQHRSRRGDNGYSGNMLDSLDLERMVPVTHQRPRSQLPTIRQDRTTAHYRAPQRAQFTHQQQPQQQQQQQQRVQVRHRQPPPPVADNNNKARVMNRAKPLPLRTVSFNPLVTEKVISPMKAYAPDLFPDDHGDEGERPTTADILKQRPSQKRLQQAQSRDNRATITAAAKSRGEQGSGSGAVTTAALKDHSDRTRGDDNVDDNNSALTKSTQLFLCAEELARKSGVSPAQILAALYRSQSPDNGGANTDASPVDLGLVPAHVRQEQAAAAKRDAEQANPVKPAKNPLARARGGKSNVKAGHRDGVESAVARAAHAAQKKREEQQRALQEAARREAEADAKRNAAEASAASPHDSDVAGNRDEQDIAEEEKEEVQEEVKQVKKKKKPRMNPHDQRVAEQLKKKRGGDVKGGKEKSPSEEVERTPAVSTHAAGKPGPRPARKRDEAKPSPKATSQSPARDPTSYAERYGIEVDPSLRDSVFEILEGGHDDGIVDDVDPLSLTVLSLEQHKLEQSIARLDAELDSGAPSSQRNTGRQQQQQQHAAVTASGLQNSTIEEDDSDMETVTGLDDGESVFSLSQVSSLTGTNTSYVGSAAGRYLPMGALQPKRRQPNRRHNQAGQLPSQRRARQRGTGGKAAAALPPRPKEVP